MPFGDDDNSKTAMIKQMKSTQETNEKFEGEKEGEQLVTARQLVMKFMNMLPRCHSLPVIHMLRRSRMRWRAIDRQKEWGKERPKSLCVCVSEKEKGKERERRQEMYRKRTGQRHRENEGGIKNMSESRE